MTVPWWEAFFDAEYIRFWSERDDARATAEADAIVKLLALPPGARVLDAPCGWGRLSRCLARRGFDVVGLDQAQPLLDRAVADRGAATNPAYRRHDLREPFPEAGFDAAINIFSSVGYGDVPDDRRILTNLVAALRPGGQLLVETVHRDALAVRFAHGAPPGRVEEDGTLFVEEPAFDPVGGFVETTWHWSGPAGSGTKHSRIRIYTITELVELIEGAGARITAVHGGMDGSPLAVSGPNRSIRVAIVAQR